MKITFKESKFCTWINLEPETPEEVGQLFRMVQNSKKEVPTLDLYFGSDDVRKPYAQIWMAKITETSSLVKTSINNRKK